MRTPLATQQVLSAMLHSPTSEHYGYELIRATGLKSGSLYPILTRLRNAGWVTAQWEEVDARTAGRPKRRLYRLTPTGMAEANRVLAETIGVLSQSSSS